MKSIKQQITLLVLIAGIIVLLFLIVLNNRQSKEKDRRAEQIILSYIEAKGLSIKPGTEEYQQFMKGILLGEHPELTSEKSTFVTNDEDRNCILNYAAARVSAGKR